MDKEKTVMQQEISKLRIKTEESVTARLQHLFDVHASLLESIANGRELEGQLAELRTVLRVSRSMIGEYECLHYERDDLEVKIKAMKEREEAAERQINGLREDFRLLWEAALVEKNRLIALMDSLNNEVAVKTARIRELEEQNKILRS